jgi:hypothetical protein
MKNQTTVKALHLLSRPLSVGAILLLLINDHVLRIYWPSWWTGKIGDFAWLYFTPLVVAALIAWLVPSRWKHHDLFVITLSIGVTGTVFTLGNTSPAFHLWLVNHLEGLLEFPVGLRRDPSDLIALISLAICWWTWSKSSSTTPDFAFRGIFLIPVAAVLTIANSAAPEPDNKGIDCLELRQDRIYALAAERYFDDDTFYSEDGGYSWEISNQEDRPDCVPTENGVVWDPFDPETRFRFSTFPIIEISSDGGNSWREDFRFEPFGEIEIIIYRNRHDGPFLFHLNPQDALIEPTTGRVLFAMGYRGLLIREMDGKYTWVKVGPYKNESDPHPDMASSLLEGQYFLAISFSFLGLASLSSRLHKKVSLLTLIGLIWAVLAYTVFMSTPEMFAPTGLGYGFPPIFYGGLIGVTLCVSFASGAWSLIYIITDHKRSLWHILAPAIIAGMIFIVPFYLWVYLIIPEIKTTAIIAFSTAIIPLLIGDHFHRVYLKSSVETETPIQENLESPAE